MEQRLNNKVALITGGGVGIGRSIALRFAEEGAYVVIIGRNQETLSSTANLHENINYTVADIKNSNDLDNVTTFLKDKYGNIDILVNNAGVAPVTTITEIGLDEYDDVFDTNVKGVVALTTHLLPMLLENNGNIINISSTGANSPIKNMSLYSASKAALLSLTKGWAKELAPENVRVNSVAVGPIETAIYDKTDLSKEDEEKHRNNVLKLIPINHFGQPEDVASVVAFLASEEAKFVTGADYAVDGGVMA